MIKYHEWSCILNGPLLVNHRKLLSWIDFENYRELHCLRSETKLGPDQTSCHFPTKQYWVGIRRGINKFIPIGCVFFINVNPRIHRSEFRQGELIYCYVVVKHCCYMFWFFLFFMELMSYTSSFSRFLFAIMRNKYVSATFYPLFFIAFYGMHFSIIFTSLLFGCYMVYKLEWDSEVLLADV